MTKSKPRADALATPGLPLSALLSFALVAFTIEFDNEAERRMVHSTTDYKSAGFSRGPWLVSMAMWFNCMRFVDDKGITVERLSQLARTHTNLDGMRRWGYVEISSAEAGKKSKAAQKNWVLRPTLAGRIAQEIWRPLFGEIEDRWRERFGKSEIAALRKSLLALVQQFPFDPPDCMPIPGYGLWTAERVLQPPAVSHKTGEDAGLLPLPALLARVLVAFAISYERESPLSLAITANILRVLDKRGVRLRDLPLLTGVSKESISMAMGILRKQELAILESDASATRGKIVYPTPKGLQMNKGYLPRTHAVEQAIKDRLGKDKVIALRASLEKLVADGTRENSPLFSGLEPSPECWRAKIPKPQTLPHYPMILHRGGYPDGS